MKTNTRKTTRILCASTIAAMTMFGSIAPTLTTVAAEQGSTTAATVEDTSSTTKANQISFEKKILLDANENVPNAKINYTLKGKDVTSKEVEALKQQKFYNVKSGTVSLSADSTEFKATDNVLTNDGTRFITKTSKIDASDLLKGVTQPTVFAYTITETVEDPASSFVLPKNGNTRNLYIFVGYKNETDKNLSVLGSIITTEDVTPEKTNKVPGFENEYVTSDNDEKTTAYKVTKNVTGNQGDKTEYFNFTVTISNQHSKVTTEGGKEVSANTPTASNSTVTVKTKLKDGESLVLRGLTKGATYEVVEDDSGKNGYTTTTKRTTDLATKTEETTFTNERKGTIPTGIYLNHKLPFNILGVALAGGAVALIAKKRHEDALEDEDDE